MSRLERLLNELAAEVEELEAAAKREAAKLSNLRLAGDLAEEVDRGPLTLGELADRYREDPVDGPESMTDSRAARVRAALVALERFLGRDFTLAELAPADWRRFHDHRTRGVIDHRGRQVPEGERRPISDATASKDLQVLRQLAIWATETRDEDGNYLLADDPTRELKLKWNNDPRRPIGTDELLAGLREAAPKVRVQVKPATRTEEAVTEPTPLPTLIEVANGTGRRLGSLLGLRWGDWDPGADFPDLGLQGALTFRAEFDKLGRTQTVPVLPQVRETLEAHRASQPDILPEGAWVFPSPTDPDKPLDKNVAIGWLQEAEVAARGEHVKGFGFHAFRRRWVNRVGRSLPPATAAKLGGWKDATVMQGVYERLPDLEETAAALAQVAEAGGAG